MTYFRDLDALRFNGFRLLIDIDGTLVHDGGTDPCSQTVRTLQSLRARNEVFLCSNSADVHRTRLLAQRLGVSFIDSPFKKPDSRLLDYVRGKPTLPVVVVGDKYLTDGRLARFIGAPFIKVRRINSPNDSFLSRFSYAFDDMAAFLNRTVEQISPYVSLARPAQWIKNVLVFAPIFFAGAAFQPQLLFRAGLAFGIFSIFSSVAYICNDLIDTDTDRRHPEKRRRPLAFGSVSRRGAIVLGVVLFLVGISSSLVALPEVLPIVLSYAALTVAYSAYFKKVAVIDVIMIGFFYLLRVLSGGAATGTAVSSWLCLSLFFLALFFVMGKRKAEIGSAHSRLVMNAYAPETVNGLLLASAILSLGSYSLYSVLVPDDPYAVYSSIFVAVALFRTLNNMYLSRESEFPETFIFKDAWVGTAFLCWLAFVYLVVYL